MNSILKFLYLSLGLMSSLSVNSQVCPQKDYFFTDQLSIDAFADLNMGCTIIEGDVQIEESASGAITSLEGLAGIRVIRGSLQIFDTKGLIHMDGLEGLDSIHSGITLYWMPNLENIHALTTTPFIGKEITISSCPELKFIDPFTHVQTLEGLYLNNLPITDLNAFGGITQLAHLEIVHCDSLLQLDGLHLFDTLGEIHLKDNVKLRDLHGLHQLISVGELHVVGNDSLRHLNELSNLNELGHKLVIEDNAVLNSLEGLQPTLTDSIKSIRIYNNTQLAVCDNDFICEAIGNPAVSIWIQENAPGCKSYLEVFSSCLSGCPPEIRFYSQRDVDQFPTWFPDCKDITGDVFIHGRESSPIHNLDSLYTIQSISGKLWIESNPRLQHISGLKNLESLGGELRIFSNDSVRHLFGLEGLSSLGTVVIDRNEMLEDLQGLNQVVEAQSISLQNVGRLTGLERLENVNGDFTIKGIEFESCQGVPLLETISGGLTIDGTLSLLNLDGFEQLTSVGKLRIYNTGIRDLEGLTGLTVVDSHFLIIYNDSLFSLQGLHHLNRIGGNIEITYNKSLTDIKALEFMTEINGNLDILSNYVLQDIDELQQVALIRGGCRILSNKGLQQLNGLQNLTEVYGHLELGNLPIANCEGLQKLRKVGGDLQILSNDSLVDLSGFNQLDSVYGELSLYGLGFDTIDAFKKLDYVGGSFALRYNSELISLDGLDSLRSVGGLWIEENRRMQLMDGLGRLEEIRGDINLSENHRLKRLPFWHGITSIAGDVIIDHGPDLADLKGLDSLRNIQGMLSLQHGGVDSLNGLEQLEFCKGGLNLIYTYLDDLDPLANLKSIQGPILIHDNYSLKDIQGLQNLDPGSIYSASGASALTITSNAYLTECAIAPLCGILNDAEKSVVIADNNRGCDNIFQLQTICEVPYGCLQDGITFSRQSQIDSFTMLYPQCTFIQGDVHIEEKTAGDITSLDSLKNVEIIGGSLRFVKNKNLAHVNGLENLKKVGGGIRFSVNSLLNNLEGLRHVDPFSLTLTRPEAYEVWMQGNQNLHDCALDPICTLFTIPEAIYLFQGNGASCSHPDSIYKQCIYPVQCELDTITYQGQLDEFPIRFPACTTLLGNLIIRAPNFAVINVNDLSVLKSLTSVQGSIKIISADYLTNLDGLENITEIDGQIYIYSNDRLENINGLRNIDPESISEVNRDYLRIQYNPLLSDCSLNNICQVIQRGESTSVIYNNGPGCESYEEVLSACIVTVPRLEGMEAIQVFPNPTSGELTIVPPDGGSDPFVYTTVYNATGARMFAGEFNTSISIQDFYPGLYTLICQTKDNRYYSARIVLMK